MIQGLDIWYQRTRDGRRLIGDGLITLPKMLRSEYFHSQIWISFVDDPLGVKMVGSVLDGDKVMFGSDYPHPPSTWPNSQQVIQEQWQESIRELLVDERRQHAIHAVALRNAAGRIDDTP